MHLGIPDKLFSHQGGLITKDDIRIFTLAKLHLPREGVFWDVGSGSGSVAIEAALLAPDLTIYAVEKYEKRVRDIKKNIKKFGVAGDRNTCFRGGTGHTEGTSQTSPDFYRGHRGTASSHPSLLQAGTSSCRKNRYQCCNP